MGNGWYILPQYSCLPSVVGKHAGSSRSLTESLTARHRVWLGKPRCGEKVVPHQCPAEQQLSRATRSWAPEGLLLGSVLTWRQPNQPPRHSKHPLLEKLPGNTSTCFEKTPTLIYNNLRKETLL